MPPHLIIDRIISLIPCNNGVLIVIIYLIKMDKTMTPQRNINMYCSCNLLRTLDSRKCMKKPLGKINALLKQLKEQALMLKENFRNRTHLKKKGVTQKNVQSVLLKEKGIVKQKILHMKSFVERRTVNIYIYTSRFCPLSERDQY